MDSGKILDIAMKGSSILNSVRKINKAMNTYRIFSFVALGVVIILNIIGVINTIKQ